MTDKFTDYKKFVENVGKRLVQYNPRDDMPILGIYSLECSLERVVSDATGTTADRVYTYTWANLKKPSAICTIQDARFDVGENLEDSGNRSQEKVLNDVLNVAKKRNDLLVIEGSAQKFKLVEQWPMDEDSMWGVNPHYLACGSE